MIEPTRTDKHSAQWIASLENHVPARVWLKPIDAIEPPELLQALREIRPHERARRHAGDSVPETVQRIRQRLEAVFEDAIFHKRCTVNPAAAIKRKMREEQPRRDRGAFAALPYREAPALLAELRKHESIAARCLEMHSDRVWCAADAQGAACIFGVCSASTIIEGYAGQDGILWAVKAARMRRHLRPVLRYLPGHLRGILSAYSGLMVAVDADDAMGARLLRSLGFAPHDLSRYSADMVLSVYRMEGASQGHGEPSRPSASLN